jgi:hypothetical protein
MTRDHGDDDDPGQRHQRLSAVRFIFPNTGLGCSPCLRVSVVGFQVSPITAIPRRLGDDGDPLSSHQFTQFQHLERTFRPIVFPAHNHVGIVH